MAEYATVASHIKLHVHEDCVKKRCSLTKNSNIQIQRKCSSGSFKVMQLSSWKVFKLSASCFANVRVNFCLKKNYMRCCCFGSLINSDGATTFDWVPVVNQGFLIASIFLTYMAGIIPAEKSVLKYRKNILKDHVLPEDSTFSGSATINDEDFNLKFAWNIVEGKLVDSLNAIEHVDNLGDRVIKFEQDHARRPLSLYAIDEGPRLRLLWASFQWLKQEVDNISGSSVIVCTDVWLKVLSEIILKSNQPVFRAWLEKELRLKKSQPDKALSSMVEKLKGNSTILQNMRKSGKEDLYADFICFLTSGFLREDCGFDCSLFSLHGVAILEDLVITLADGIASMYLELISVDGDMSNEMNSLGLVLCTLSTRELQRLRNEVALNQWLHQNMEAVVLMYEDRFDLCTLQSQLIEESSQSQNEKFSWWKKLTMRKSGFVSSPLRYVAISYISVPIKRTKELRALTGWRYYFSLFLELADITMPMIRTIVAKTSEAISFFLVCLIGRSLGLIYTGIRQSLRWK